MKWKTTFLVLTAILSAYSLPAAEVLVEAESFDDRGGWVADSQFIDLMGSPYLLAHGLGRPVSNAHTQVSFPETGTYSVWVRTKDWVPEPEWAPGRFQVLVDGEPLGAVFGTTGAGAWIWQAGGEIEIKQKTVRVELRDLTGFDGRCDAIFFTTSRNAIPTAKTGDEMRAWRKKLLGIPKNPKEAGSFDVVVVGGGVSGCAAALTAARLGCKVAIVQNRPVYGGNNSAEIGVWGARWGKPAPFVTREVYGLRGTEGKRSYRAGDDGRKKVLDNEKDITQFLGWHVFDAKTKAGRILYVDAVNTETAEEIRITASTFIDATGDGWVGYHAGADFRYGEEGREDNGESLAPKKPSRMVLGATLHWGAKAGEHAVAFPDVPWATAVSKDCAALGGGWTWEYGHHRDMIWEAEEIRDYLFRSIYGSFATAKQNEPKKLAKHELHRVVHNLGKRESRRLMGDYIMTQMDCTTATNKPDRVGISNNPFDIHVPSERYDFRIRVDEHYGGLGKRTDADIPFRSLYSRNIETLMMAGRCISVTHIAHSSTRVMNTGSQTGIAVGAAAFLCKKYDTTPREIGKKHIKELQDIVFGKGKYSGALTADKASAVSDAP